MKSTTTSAHRRAARSTRRAIPAPQRPGVAVRPYLIYAALFGAVLVAYWPALRGGMLWDDSAHVTKPALQSLQGLWRIWFSPGTTQQYYPLLYSAFWVEHQFWGDAVLGYHLANLAQHAVAACLVVLILRRLALPGAWLAGLLFALHPVCVEAVAWISEQKSTLSAVFYLASALVYLSFDQTRRRSSYFWALGLFVLALLTKTVTATLPGALLVIFWWQRGRLSGRRDVRPLLPWLALGAMAGILTAWMERHFVGAQGPDYAWSPIQRILLAGRAICFYAAKLVWPFNLTFNYPRWKLDPSAPWQYLYVLGVLAAAIAFYYLAQKKQAQRAPLAVLLLFAGTLFPVLGFLNVYPFIYSFVADHFQYLASLAILVPAAVVATRAMAGLTPARRAAAAAVLPVMLGALTFHQSGDYRDVETLYRQTLARNPDSWMAHNNLGVLLADQGRLNEAVAEYKAALRLNPNDASAHNNLANAMMQMPGREAEAIAEYVAGLRILPSMAEAHNNLAVLLSRTPGQAPAAIAEFETALRLAPDFAAAHNDFGAVLLSVPGRRADAIAQFRAALALSPNDPRYQGNLQLALSRQ
jgi:tetratricopeptide (TPR) repeat protein